MVKEERETYGRKAKNHLEGKAGECLRSEREKCIGEMHV